MVPNAHKSAPRHTHHGEKGSYLLAAKKLLRQNGACGGGRFSYDITCKQVSLH